MTGTGTLPLDVDAIRADFPALEESCQGRPLVYLDNAATTQTPASVARALLATQLSAHGNVHRGVGRLAARTSEAYEAARGVVARFVGAAPDELVFTGGCTDGLNLAARALGESCVGSGDEVLVTALEHHSNYLPWWELARRRGARLIVAPTDARGWLDPQSVLERINPRTRLVAATHLSNVTGQLLPIADFASAAARVGAKLVVDGAQAAAQVPVRVTELGCDAYALSAHKLYGPFGIGALYLRGAVAPSLKPGRYGGGMVARVEEGSEPSYLPGPARFEAGTPNVSGAVGFRAAVEYVGRLGWAARAAHSAQLAEAAGSALAQVDGLRIFGRTPHLGVYSFALEGVHPHDVATLLDQAGIQVRAGQLCAQPLMRSLGQAAVVRASFGIYNRLGDVSALASALAQVRAQWGT